MTDYMEDPHHCGNCGGRVYSMYGHARFESGGKLKFTCDDPSSRDYRGKNGKVKEPEPSKTIVEINIPDPRKPHE